MDMEKIQRTEHAARTAAAEYDQGLRAYMQNVYAYMSGALTITGLVALFTSMSQGLMSAIFNTPLQWVVMLAPLGVVFYLSARLNKMSVESAQAWFWGFAALMGLSLSYIFLVYTGASITRTFFITAAAFGSLSLYGYTTKKDISAFGSFLIMGVVGLIIASLVNIFMQSTALHFAISVLGVLIFAGLTAYDTQRIKNSYYAFGGDRRTAIMGALSLYLDFINLFIHLLQFVGDRR